MFSEKKILAIDIGSNAIRGSLGIYDGSNDLEVIKSFRFPVRLGQDVFSKGKISKSKISEIEDTFSKFKTLADEENVEVVKAVATSALRNSSNGSEILQLIKTKFDIEIVLINGREEAELISKAVSSTIPMSGAIALLIDIGGGSTEISVVDHGRLIFSHSYPIGTVRLIEKTKKKDLLEVIRPVINEAFEEISKVVSPQKISLFAGTGGNLKRMGKLRKLFFSRHPHKISQQELIAINLEVSKLPLEKRVQFLSMRKDRADVIVPAMEIVECLMVKFNAQEILLPLVGLKEGIFIDVLKETPRSIVFD